MQAVRFLGGVLFAVVALFGVAKAANAEVHCEEADARGIQQCLAWMAPELTRRMQITQEESQWCWAAVVEMVLARYGVSVPQAEIVRRHLGQATNTPIFASGIAGLIGREWRGSEGRTLKTRARHNGMRGQAPASAGLLVDSLTRNEPLVLAAQGHVVVVIEIRYALHKPTGMMRLTSGTVIDPLPHRGIRPMERAEMNPDFLGAIEVEPPSGLHAGLQAANIQQ